MEEIDPLLIAPEPRQSEMYVWDCDEAYQTQPTPEQDAPDL